MPLSQLEDPEITRQKVNAAARAARATTRERIARDIENRERNITYALQSLATLNQEKRALLTQFLNE